MLLRAMVVMSLFVVSVQAQKRSHSKSQNPEETRVASDMIFPVGVDLNDWQPEQQPNKVVMHLSAKLSFEKISSQPAVQPDDYGEQYSSGKGKGFLKSGDLGQDAEVEEFLSNNHECIAR